MHSLAVVAAVALTGPIDYLLIILELFASARCTITTTSVTRSDGDGPRSPLLSPWRLHLLCHAAVAVAVVRLLMMFDLSYRRWSTDIVSAIYQLALIASVLFGGLSCLLHRHAVALCCFLCLPLAIVPCDIS